MATPLRFNPMVAFAVVALLEGCDPGGAMADCKAEFAKGQYPRAKEDLLAMEPTAMTWDPRGQAEYALYRGLTSEALGNRDEAVAWLRAARTLEEAAPGSLSRLDAQRLRVGLDTVR